jgi:poly-gamma-glutamate capsule biosynthesis protein CapA/YwtB (metallophosphatase superfamily)
MKVVRVCLWGDVMTGRGVDQILPHPSDPRIHEAFVRDARAYVRFAEEAHGPFPRPVEYSYIWGDALAELERAAPAARVANLETSVTQSDDRWPKGINYRMHPANVPCLTAAGIDVCALANNHVLDYGPAGLLETLEALRGAGLRTAGAGRNLAEARRPAVVDLPNGRLFVFALGAASAGVPVAWAATSSRQGVDFLPDPSDAAAAEVEGRVRRAKEAGALVIVSIHWGSNWGYDVDANHVRFAHRLIDAGADIVHGHSSHHPRPIEVYRHRLVLYGCGDLIDDYEGIRGREEFRHDLRVMYLATLRADTGKLTALELTPMQMRNMRLNRVSAADAAWIAATLTEACGAFGTAVETTQEGTLRLGRTR